MSERTLIALERIAAALERIAGGGVALPRAGALPTLAEVGGLAPVSPTRAVERKPDARKPCPSCTSDQSCLQKAQAALAEIVDPAAYSDATLAASPAVYQARKCPNTNPEARAELGCWVPMGAPPHLDVPLYAHGLVWCVVNPPLEVTKSGTVRIKAGAVPGPGKGHWDDYNATIYWGDDPNFSVPLPDGRRVQSYLGKDATLRRAVALLADCFEDFRWRDPSRPEAGELSEIETLAERRG